MKRGFTLIELLVVIAIVAVLAALIFPVFTRAKAAARQSVCINNLSQIGKAISLYMSEHDDVFPHALDPSDKWHPEIWDGFPDFRNRIDTMPLLTEVLMPYIREPEVFHCPSDSGTHVLDNHFPDAFPTKPSMFKVYGSSYFFRTEIAFKYYSNSQFELPAAVNVMFDGAGHWHSPQRPLTPNDDLQTFNKIVREYRYNTLFGDMHVKSLRYDKLQEAWQTEL